MVQQSQKQEQQTSLAGLAVRELFHTGLVRIRQLLNREVEIQMILDGLIQSIEEQYPDMIGSILLLEGSYLQHCSSTGLSEEYRQAINGLMIGLDTGSCGTAAFTGKRVIVEDIATHPYWAKYKEAALRAGLRASWSQPIFSADGKVLGAFALYYRHVKAPSPDEIALLETAAEIAGVAIEMKQAEEALKESEERFRTMADSAPLMIWLMEPSGVIPYYNKKALEFMGLPAGQSVPQSWGLALHPTERDSVSARLMEAIAKHESVELECQVKRADGQYRWVLMSFAPRYDRTGEFLGFVGSAIDIHDRKQMEQALKEREERYRLVVEGTNDGVWDWNIQTNESYWNDRYYEILGLSKDNPMPLGEAWMALVHPDDREQIKQMYRTHVEQHVSYEYEFRILHSSGEYRHCISRGEIIRDEQGQPIRMLGTITDITERKKAQGALQKSLDRERLTRRVIELSNQTLDLESILHTVAQEVGQFFKADRTAIVHYQFDQEQYRVDLFAQYCLSDEVKPIDLSDMSPKLLDILMRSLAHQNNKEIVRASNQEEYFDYLKSLLQEEPLRPDEMTLFSEELKHLLLERYHIHSHLRVPIIYRDTPYGGISLQCRYNRVWQEEEVFILQEMATQIGNAFYQIELSQQERKAFEREHLIRKIVEVIGQSFDIDLILKTVAEAVGQYLQTDRCSVTRYSFDGQHLNVNMSAQYCAPDIMPADPEDERLLMNAMRHLRPDALRAGDVQVLNVSDQDAYLAYLKERMSHFDLPGLSTEQLIEMVKKYNVKASLRVNIDYRGTPYGSISVSQSAHNRQWRPDEVELVKTIAEQVGSAIYQVELYRQEQQAREEAEMRLKRESLMRRIVEIVNRSLDVEVIMNSVAQELGYFLNVDRTVLMRYTVKDQAISLLLSTQYCGNSDVQPLSAEDMTLVLKAIQYMTPETLYEGQDQIIHMSDLELERVHYLDRAKKLQMPDLNMEDLKRLSQKYAIKSFLRVGIFYRGIPYGSIALHQSNRREWQPQEIELVNSLADQLGIALNQAELYQLEQQARKEERRAREEAEEANRKKSEFLAMMSHELRTPLNSIIGYSRMIENGMGGPMTEQQTKYIHNVSLSGNHLLNLVNDLLDVSKVEAGKMIISPGHFEINDVINDVKSIMTTLANKNHILLSFHVLPDIGGIEADFSRFKQILINLISNAIKFNNPGGAVSVHLTKTEDGQWLIGEVQDTGIGIPQEKQPELFKKFYQVDTSASRPKEGTGLGLALTKELIELHGGDISVESEEGIGSTFTFRLPVHSKIVGKVERL